MTITSKQRQNIERGREVAATIKQQITPGVLMSLGASDFAFTVDGDTGEKPGLTFKARIIPKGKRAVRKMRVTVTLTGRDDYDIEVGYLRGGRGPKAYDWVVDYQASGVYADQLARVLLALDDADR